MYEAALLRQLYTLGLFVLKLFYRMKATVIVWIKFSPVLLILKAAGVNLLCKMPG